MANSPGVTYNSCSAAEKICDSPVAPVRCNGERSLTVVVLCVYICAVPKQPLGDLELSEEGSTMKSGVSTHSCVHIGAVREKYFGDSLVSDRSGKKQNRNSVRPERPCQSWIPIKICCHVVHLLENDSGKNIRLCPV